MGRLAIRRVEYFGDRYSFESPELPDGLVIIEGANGSGKTTFADLIYFALGGVVKKFAKTGTKQHKEIRSDSNNGVRLTFQLGAGSYVITRRFDSPQDVLVASLSTERVEVLPVVRREGHRVLSDLLLEELGIHVVTLFLGTYSGKLNFTDILRLVYHDQDPDPSRVFKKVDRESFVTDSRDFRRAVFEILIGKASEEYYDVLGKLKLSEGVLSEQQAALTAYIATVNRMGPRQAEANAHFLEAEISTTEHRLVLLENTRARLRREAPNAPAGNNELVRLRQQLTSAEIATSTHEGRANETRHERIRLSGLEGQLVDEVERIEKIIHAHTTLALFTPDTCPCCLRPVDRAAGHCICTQPVDEVAYQRFFYSSDEYIAILKSKQKNVETVRAAIAACDAELAELSAAIERHQHAVADIRKGMERWAGSGAEYGTELQRFDDELVSTRVELESLRARLELERELDKLGSQVQVTRTEVERLRQRAQALEATAQQDRADKVAIFEKVYSRLMRETLAGVRFARLDGDYEPVLNEGEYREASSTVPRRLLYYLTLLEMSLADAELPFPRFLLVDTPETAGIDAANLSRALGKIAEVLSTFDAGAGQVILTTGPGRYPAELEALRVVTLTDEQRLLKENQGTPVAAVID